MSIKNRLKLLMRLLDINLKEFSEKSGIPYRTLQNYTLGLRESTIENLVKIASSFNVNLHWLLTGEGEPFIKRELQLDPRRELIAKLLLNMPDDNLDDIFKILKILEKGSLLKELLEEVKKLKEILGT
ncbi:MAG: helix-turn-helix domain-containing protein [Aquificaceae bacterium]